MVSSGLSFLQQPYLDLSLSHASSYILSKQKFRYASSVQDSVRYLHRRIFSKTNYSLQRLFMQIQYVNHSRFE